MSEDTDAKTGGRRRRTTRSERRRSSRPPADRAPPSDASEPWSPAWSADSDALPGELAEDVEAETGDTEGSAEGEGDCGAPDLEYTVGGEEDDMRRTAELVVTPFTLAQLQEEEKTNPRIRVGDLGPEHPAELAPPADPVVAFWSRPSTRSSAEELPALASQPAVIIAPAKVISDRPPPIRSARAFETAPLDETARVPAVAGIPTAAPFTSSPAASGDTETMSSAAAPLAARERGPAAAVSEQAPGAASLEHTSFEQFDGATDPPPPDPAADEGSLQLVDVDVSELEQRRRHSRTPPPPPPDARAKLTPPKRPPPPPAPNKPEDDRQKRKQARQWWERFFSDDYLMSVRPATPAQIARQVDFMEQSLAVSKGGTILDVGCGLGLHAVELTRRGYLVVGLDLSLSMITRAAELAQQQQLKLNVVHADIREMEFDGAFDGVICMGTTFGFFDDDANRDVLARLHQALRPGGRVLMDTVNRDYVIRFQPNLVWFEGDECVCMEESDFNYFNSRLTVKRTMMREDGKQSNAEYSVRLYSLHELGQLMQQVGFRVIEVSGQEAIRGAFFGVSSPRVLMLAERRALARPSVIMPLERGSAEHARPATALPPERASTETPKIPKPD
jgi:2-polyprenyl-3-methyl-5-hydroxy-6-metoxy-1,4-benzoquinol methylase